jgi:hypothetical protein
MALSKKALIRAVNSVPEGDDVGVWVVGVCRAVESEVRKHDEALILMLVERLERADNISGHANNKAAIKAGRAWLEAKK